MPHCPVTVVQRYRDGVCSLLFHLSLHLEETCSTDFWLCRMHHLEYRCKKEICPNIVSFFFLLSLLVFPFLVLVSTWGSNSDRHRYDATLLTSTLCYNARARGRSRRGTQSKMASFIVDWCRHQRFLLEMWDWRKTIAWGRCTPLTIVSVWH